ncbi:MAG: dTDP-4-dehydrorhamnose reductase [Desulfobacterales bacterium]|nr:dTDP-4-dehydrorhamnose reductase [Desulfobacterales bacterium]
MKIFVTGAKGQLGRELIQQGSKDGLHLQGIDLPEHDIADSASLKALIEKYSPELVLNAAAFTMVDKAEAEPQLAEAGNHIGPANLSEICKKQKVPLIHISTDFVFDGERRTPYLPDEPMNPLSVYGRTKAAGEEAVRELLPRHLIVRTSWLYASNGANFVATMLRLGREHKKIRVVSDQFGSPTCAADLATALLSMGRQVLKNDGPWGTYHFCGSGITSWHGFAMAIFEQAKSHTALAVEEVEPITTSEYPTPARRPAYSALDCSWTTKDFGIVPRLWQESLEETLPNMLARYPDPKES